MIERIDGDVTALGGFFSQFVILVLGNALLAAGVLALLYREDWRAGLGLTLFALFALLTLMRIRTIAVPYWTAVREMTARFFGALGEHLAGTEDIRALGAQSYVMRRFYELWRAWLPLVSCVDGAPLTPGDYELYAEIVVTLDSGQTLRVRGADEHEESDEEDDA